MDISIDAKVVLHDYRIYMIHKLHPVNHANPAIVSKLS